MKGELCVKGIVASGMVLQRNKINCIYGTADNYDLQRCYLYHTG